jgi:hypothetical protein
MNMLVACRTVAASLCSPRRRLANGFGVAARRRVEAFLYDTATERRGYNDHITKFNARL